MDSSMQEEEESQRFLNLTHHLKKEKNYNVFVESKWWEVQEFVRHKNHIPTTTTTYLLLTYQM
jgi:hypothetical protein